MNILEAMKQAKQGKIICIYGKEIYLNEKEELILLKTSDRYIPPLDVYASTIVQEYENEELLNKDIRRMLCTE